MKKIKVLLLALISINMVSCYDDSGEYIERLLLDSDITLGLQDCLRVSTDTAIAHLCVPGGFSDNSQYALTLPATANSLEDTLIAHGKQELIDSLIAQINRTAESMGVSVKAYFNSAASSLTFADPVSVLNGGNTAITNYMKTVSQSSLIESMRSPITTAMVTTGAKSTWDNALIEYNTICPTKPVSVDIVQYISQKTVTAVFAVMAIEETNIRTDPAHRVDSTLRKVFSSLD